MFTTARKRTGGNRQHSFKARRRNTSVGVAHNADAETGIGKQECDDLTRVKQTAFSVSLPIGQNGAILILYEEWQFYDTHDVHHMNGGS